MKISTNQKLFLFAFIILTINGILGYAVYKSNQKVLDSEDWVRHTEQVIYQSGNIRSIGKDIEATSKCFVITNDSAYLEPFNTARKIAVVSIRQLRQLIRDNPGQLQRIDSLNFYMRNLLNFSVKIVKLRTMTGPALTIPYASANEGRRYIHRISQIINSVQLAENILLKQRKQTSEHSEAEFKQFSVIIFILITGFTILLVIIIGKYLFQSKDKEERAAELDVANDELSFQNQEKEKRAAELVIANKELLFQHTEKGKRADELTIANKELLFQNEEKGKRAAELVVANDELSFQSQEKEKRAAELVIANKELLFQNKEKGKRAEELTIANKELLFQNGEKEKRAAELVIANEELLFQNEEKEKRAAELTIANTELLFHNEEKEKRAAELKLAEIERVKMVNELILRNKDLEQFAYIISHNLRAPVANIIGASSALNDPDLSLEDKGILSRGINTSIIKLDEVVNDLNHILQVKGEINEIKETVNFSGLLNDIKTSINKLIDKDDVEIKEDFTAINEFSTLKAYLYSIFFNLISNSVKYRRHNIPCIIEIKSRRSKNKIELLFKDNGMGIDLTKNSDQIFGLYKRFHTNIEGKGMGLFMVKTQVETLGGKISLKSEENKGTEFLIEFEK